MNGLSVLFIFYSLFEIAVRVYVCKLLFNMAFKKGRDIATREEIMKAPLVIIGFFVFTFIFEFIVYAAAFRSMLQRWKEAGIPYPVGRNFTIREWGRLLWSMLYYGYIYFRFRQYKLYAETNQFP